jgi:hypothetical protein
MMMTALARHTPAMAAAVVVGFVLTGCTQEEMAEHALESGSGSGVYGLDADSLMQLCSRAGYVPASSLGVNYREVDGEIQAISEEPNAVDAGLPWWSVLAALIIGFFISFTISLLCARSRNKQVAAETDTEADDEVPTKSLEKGAVPLTTTTSNRSAVPLGAVPPGSTVRMVGAGSAPGSTVRMVTVGSPPANVTDAIFNALDRNHDGVISPEEFGLMPAGMLPARS